MAKPIPEKVFLRYLKMVKWTLKKGSIDYNLYDENGKFIHTIKINHGSQKKRDVSATSVRKTEKSFKERDWLWPPNKKSKNI